MRVLAVLLESNGWGSVTVVVVVMVVVVVAVVTVGTGVVAWPDNRDV